jgi:hypothetical protein
MLTYFRMNSEFAFILFADSVGYVDMNIIVIISDFIHIDVLDDIQYEYETSNEGHLLCSP